MSLRAYVLGHDVVGARDEVMLGQHVAVVSFVDVLAGELDAGQVAATEDVGTAEQPWRRRWRAGAAVDGREVVGWGRGRAEAVEVLRGRLGEGARG